MVLGKELIVTCVVTGFEGDGRLGHGWELVVEVVLVDQETHG